MRQLVCIAMVGILGGCSVENAESQGHALGGSLQCDAAQKSQHSSGKCAKCNCGLGSAAMMRYAMTSCGGPVSSYSAKQMRMYYNAHFLDVEEDGHCDPDHPNNTSVCTGTWYTDIGTLLQNIHTYDHGNNFGRSCDDYATDCTSKVGRPGMLQSEFKTLLGDKGYVAAVIGDGWHGSPCYSGTLNHFIFAHRYDKATDTITVYDPNCGPSAGAKEMDAKDFFRWAEHNAPQERSECAIGSTCRIHSFVYGRGEQESASPPPPPPNCMPSVTCAGKCGAVDDGCGVILSCGGCTAPSVCGGGGKNVCGYNDDEHFPIASWMTGTLANGGACAQRMVDGTLRMTPCSPTDVNQNWSMTGERHLRNHLAQTCAQPATNGNGSKVSAKACTNDALQEWYFREMEIVNGKTGKCLHVANDEYVDGGAITYRECSGKMKQRFNYNTATSVLKPSTAPSLCLQGNATPDTIVVLRSCVDGRASQSWNDALGGFVNGAAGLCLGVEGGPSSDEGASVEVSACSGTSLARMWGLRGTIANGNQTRCLRSTGSDLEIATCDEDDAAQVFTYWMNF